VVRSYYIEGFADPDLVTYGRTPDQVTVSYGGPRFRARQVARHLAQPEERLRDERRVFRSLGEEERCVARAGRGLRHPALYGTDLRSVN
jgi:hypothetical protein